MTATHRRRAAFTLGSLLLAAAAGCLEDRPRPAPPLLRITLDRDTVRSPDTLSGTVRADDPDGIDSIWLAVDSARDSADATFQTTFQAPFSFPIKGSHALGEHVPIVFQARDVTGFIGMLDTFVVVKGP